MLNPKLLLIAGGSLIAAVALAELPFLEPTSEEWQRMSEGERKAAMEKLSREHARQREEIMSLDQDQQSGVCHVHQLKMERRTVRIQYGMIVPSDLPGLSREQFQRLLAARPAKFPNANEFVSGGCAVNADSPKTRDIFLCPKCVEAKKKFFAELGGAD